MQCIWPLLEDGDAVRRWQAMVHAAVRAPSPPHMHLEKCSPAVSCLHELSGACGVAPLSLGPSHHWEE